jgi:hypothetical protein
MVNKAMWAIDRTDVNLSSFRSDPAGFLEGWERLAEDPEPPYPDGGTLTSEERAALETLDIGALYAMGSNPFLLWQLVRSVLVPDRMSIDELIVEFRLAVEPHGDPDFST